jgi:hypothetical protein
MTSDEGPIAGRDTNHDTVLSRLTGLFSRRSPERAIAMNDKLIFSEVPLSELLARRAERRAVDAALWGMPAVNYDLML